MPKKTARIGKDDERQIVKDLEGAGYRARRQPGSGNRAVDMQHDVVWLDSPAGKLHIEGKYRRDCAWKVIDKWRGDADILTLRCDGRVAGQDGDRLAVLKWSTLLALVGEAAERCSMEDLADIEDASDPIDKFLRAPGPVDPDERICDTWARRQRIQSAHQNPPLKPPKRNRMQSRGFPKQKVKADE